MESFTLSLSWRGCDTVLSTLTQYKYIVFQQLMDDDCQLNPTLLLSYLTIFTCVVFSITGYVSCFHKTRAVNMSKLKTDVDHKQEIFYMHSQNRSLLCRFRDNTALFSLLKAKYLMYLNKLQSFFSNMFSNVCLVFIVYILLLICSFFDRVMSLIMQQFHHQ